MTLQLLRVIRNSFVLPTENCSHYFGRHTRHYKFLRSGYRYSERGLRRGRGDRISSAVWPVGARVHSVTRSLRYFYTARPTFTIVKEKVTMPENKQFQRLPRFVVPKHYDLELVPNLQEFTFTGKTAVKVSVSGNFIIDDAKKKTFPFHPCVCLI